MIEESVSTIIFKAEYEGNKPEMTYNTPFWMMGTAVAETRSVEARGGDGGPIGIVRDMEVKEDGLEAIIELALPRYQEDMLRRAKAIMELLEDTDKNLEELKVEK